MLYVLLEIWIWMVGAALVGAAFGWWLRSLRAHRQVAREALLWRRRIRRLHGLATGLRDEASADPRPDD